MRGTFRPGDFLDIEEISLDKLKRGDVIVYIFSEAGKEENRHVHRIVGFAANGLITRGDNNRKRDLYPVSDHNLIGRVASYERHGKIYKVRNGGWGVCRARVLRGRLLATMFFKSVFRMPYAFLRDGDWVRKLWHPRIEKIRFQTAAGPLLKFTHKGKTVANWWIKSDNIYIHRPYDLILWKDLQSMRKMGYNSQR